MTEGPRRYRASPRSMRGSAAEKPLLHTRRGRRRDPKNKAEHPTRSSNRASPQHALSGRLQQTEETSRRNSAAPSPVGPPLRSTEAQRHRENSPSRHTEAGRRDGAAHSSDEPARVARASISHSERPTPSRANGIGGSRHST